jgi:Zn-finger nucleic acid-binding protein
VQGFPFYTELLQEEKMQEVQGRVEMKYCERCGALWLRGIGSRKVYCRQCERQMRELPLAGHQKAGMRRRETALIEVDVLQASAETTAIGGGAF